jgi:hypothetical protein
MDQWVNDSVEANIIECQNHVEMLPVEGKSTENHLIIIVCPCVYKLIEAGE